jgi:hypothetical protein
MQKLKNNFCQVDIERIVQIPLSSRVDEDWMVWNYEKSGLYTVKSAYRMLVSQLGDEQQRKACHLQRATWKCGNGYGV